jgi:hypothetical protein
MAPTVGRAVHSAGRGVVIAGLAAGLLNVIFWALVVTQGWF